MHLFAQVSVLFLAGAIASLAVITLHVEHRVLWIGPDTEDGADPVEWWMLISCGLGSVGIGLLYPLADKTFGSKPNVEVTLSTFVRQLIIFVGLNLASVKFAFENNAEMAFTLAFISILVWWIGDRSRIGFLLSCLQTFIGTCTVQSLALIGVFGYPDADFVVVRSWLPALLFAGCVCCGSLGRILVEPRSTSPPTSPTPTS
eukprot:m.14485 g.14485  ORF g.14485 m.14485 type:complete len:202 (-) comp10156_c0_seq1:112-717(-)